MSGNLRLNGATSGYSELAAPDVAGDQTFTFPSSGGTLATQPSNGSLPGYQQGTWTPELAQVSNIATKATNYANQKGRWWRIGNAVYASCTINLGGSEGLASLSTALCVIGYPYKCESNAPSYGNSSSVHANGWTQNTVVSVNVLMRNADSRTNPIYYASSTKAGDYGEMQYNHIGSGSLIYTMSYITDDTTWTPINGATVS